MNGERKADERQKDNFRERERGGDRDRDTFRQREKRERLNERW